MRKFLSIVTALFLAGGAALATNIPLRTGPLQPANVLDAINNLIVSINNDSPGLYAFIPGPVASTAVTAQQVLATTSMPVGTLTAAGQGIRISCAGTSAANTDAKQVGIKFGTITLSSASFSTSGETWYLTMVVNAATNPVTASSVYFGSGLTNTTAVAPIAGADTATADNLATQAINIQCLAAGGSASTTGDQIMQSFLVESIK